MVRKEADSELREFACTPRTCPDDIGILDPGESLSATATRVVYYAHFRTAVDSLRVGPSPETDSSDRYHKA